MNKVKAFFDATGAFFRWCWKYPTTPIENFQDARFRYQAQTDPELKKTFDELEKLIREHDTKRKV
jgi:hypothetical protein